MFRLFIIIWHNIYTSLSIFKRMKDKDLLVVIAEMLRKQDQQTQILTNQSLLLEKTNETLNTFMEVSVKQFEQQQSFNEQYLQLNRQVVERLEKIEKKL